MSTRKTYPSDLSDVEWHLLEPLVPAPKSGGRPIAHPRRELLNAIFYVVRQGCTWRALPHDLPPWQTVYHYFRLWRNDGTWERLHTALREQVRVQAGRPATPSAAILDSQSVKTGPKRGLRGYDAGKQVKGRKRHLLVDTEGLVLQAVVHGADVQDRDGARLVMRALGFAQEHDAPFPFPRLRHLWADGGYAGAFVDWVREHFGWTVEIVKRPPDQQGFAVLPRRWVVERTFAWFGHFRRLNKDVEYLVESSEAMLYIAMSHLMLRRLAKQPATQT
ncbi:MAG: IS5 family transposase [Ktedonobacterales bacterium]